MFIWLASYPKSGNTYLRTLLANYLYPISNNQNSLENLQKIKKFPDKFFYKNFLKEKNISNLNSEEKFYLNISNWIVAQNLLNQSKENLLLKTHNVYCSIDEKIKFTNSKLTSAFIYITRDPRNVALSYSNHMVYNHEKSVSKILESTLGNEDPDIFEVYGNWETNYLSWKKFTDVPSLFLKYEDLVKNTEDEFQKILNFLSKYLNFSIDESKIKNSIFLSQFHKLKRDEIKFGFREAANNQIFFDKGPERDWKKELDPKLSELIEKKFYNTMKKLNYL